MFKKRSFGERLAQAAKEASEKKSQNEIEFLKETLRSALKAARTAKQRANEEVFKQHQGAYLVLEELVQFCKDNGLEGDAVSKAEALLIENKISPLEEPK